MADAPFIRTKNRRPTDGTRVEIAGVGYVVQRGGAHILTSCLFDAVAIHRPRWFPAKRTHWRRRERHG